MTTYIYSDGVVVVVLDGDGNRLPLDHQRIEPVTAPQIRQSLTTHLCEACLDRLTRTRRNEDLVADGADAEAGSCGQWRAGVDEELTQLRDLVLKCNERLDQYLALKPVVEADIVKVFRSGGQVVEGVHLSQDGGADGQAGRVVAAGPGIPHVSSSVGGDGAPVAPSGSGASEPTEEARNPPSPKPASEWLAKFAEAPLHELRRLGARIDGDDAAS